jgi:hypothetical protein
MTLEQKLEKLKAWLRERQETAAGEAISAATLEDIAVADAQQSLCWRCLNFLESLDKDE